MFVTVNSYKSRPIIKATQKFGLLSDVMKSKIPECVTSLAGFCCFSEVV